MPNYVDQEIKDLPAFVHLFVKLHDFYQPNLSQKRSERFGYDTIGLQKIDIADVYCCYVLTNWGA